MSYEMDDLGVARVAEYFARIGQHLPHKAQRASFATYAFGILADGERKSVEPIAARACADPRSNSRGNSPKRAIRSRPVIPTPT